jgi:hypothetical protein
MKALASVTVALLVGLAPADDTALNDKVLQFARDHMGEKVGDGQCTSLAVEALRSAGAKVDPFRDDGNFVWGRQLEALKDAKPGDVLQFRDAVFRTRRRLPGGGIQISRSSYPHHTAIVAEVKGKASAKVLVILHQNYEAPGQDKALKQTVQRGTLYLADLQKGGWIRAYRPEAEEDEKARDADDPFKP